MPDDPSPRPDEPPTAAAVFRPVGVLTVTAPPAQAGRAVVIDPQGTTVGRDAICDLALASEYIGRHQAIVRFDGERYVIEDLGSKNPTLLNGDPVAGTRPLRHGDRLTFADVQVAFQITGGPMASPRRAGPSADESWHPDAPTTPLGQARREPRQSLRRQLHDAPGFSATGLLIAVLGAMVGTVLTGAVGAGPWGTLLGAAVGPVVTTTFTTKRAGEKGRVRTAAIVILSAGAVLITWAGVGLADQAAGKSVVPGAADRPNTFPGPAADGSPSTAAPTPSGETATTSSPAPTTSGPAGPAAAPSPLELDCGTAAVGETATCPPLLIENVGTEVLRITGVELAGDASGDFSAGQSCVGASLAPGESCEMTVAFSPQDGSDRRATLVVHQNIPPPDTGTRISLRGIGGSRRRSTAVPSAANSTNGGTSPSRPATSGTALRWASSSATGRSTTTNSAGSRPPARRSAARTARMPAKNSQPASTRPPKTDTCAHRATVAGQPQSSTAPASATPP